LEGALEHGSAGVVVVVSAVVVVGFSAVVVIAFGGVFFGGFVAFKSLSTTLYWANKNI
jgi:hypothetical protein